MNPPLSISIPPPSEGIQARQKKQKLRSESGSVAAEQDARNTKKQDEDEATPRNQAVELPPQSKNEADEGEGNTEDSKSDQSSICQSPSWEGYGQKKKHKKMEAEHRKKEKEKVEQDAKPCTRRKTTNRLYKSPPQDFHGSVIDHQYSSGSSIALHEKSSEPDTAPVEGEPHAHRRTIPDTMGMTKCSKIVDERPFSAYPRAATSSAPLDDSSQRHRMQFYGTDNSMTGTKSVSEERTVNASQSTIPPGITPPSIIAPPLVTAVSDKTSYPPLSSRSHNLSGPLIKVHSRRNSASAIVSSGIEEVSKMFRAKNATVRREPNTHSTETTSMQAALNSTDRGRQSRETSDTGSYVHKVRSQSIERSITVFMEQAELSIPNGPSNQHGLPQERHETHKWRARHRISLSQTRQSAVETPMGDRNGFRESAANIKAIPSQQHQSYLQRNERKILQVSNQKSEHRSEPSAPSEKTDSSKHEREAAGNFGFASKSCAPPTLDLTTPTSGIFSSIKSRINRRGSDSSGTTSAAARGFKEMAMAAMHLPVPSMTTRSLQPYNPKPEESQSTISSPTMTEGYAPFVFRKQAQKLSTAVYGSNKHIAKVTSSQTTQASSRPSEVSSNSSFHDGSSMMPSHPSTPDTSRPQSAKGLPVATEEIQVGNQNILSLGEDKLGRTRDTKLVEIETRSSLPEQLSSRSLGGSEKADVRMQPVGRSETDSMIIERFKEGKGGRSCVNINDPRKMEDIGHPISQCLSENTKRPESHDHILEDTTQFIGGSGLTSADTERRHTTKDDGPTVDCSTSLADGLGILNRSCSQNAITPDIDNLSFVTTLTNQESQYDSISDSRNTGSDATMSPKARNTAKETPELSRQTSNTMHETFMPSFHETKGYSLPTATSSESDHQSQKKQQLDQPQTRNTSRREGKRENQHTKHKSAARDEPRKIEQMQGQVKKEGSLMLRRPKTLRNTTTNNSFIPAVTQGLKSKMPTPINVQSRVTAVPVHSSTASSDAALPTPPLSSPGRNPSSSAHLQEARRSGTMVSSPLSKVIRSAKANMSSPSLPVRPKPDLETSTSFPNRQASKYILSLPTPPLPSAALSPTALPSPPLRSPAKQPDKASKPIAKMLVECCHCRFLHDMPSRVYECMAQPDAVVTDRSLGVSGAITTMVKCPWCAHNMSKQCCAGYAAVIYLKERLH